MRAVLDYPMEVNLKDKRMIKKNDFKGFGESLAKEFIAKGAKELLKKLRV